MFSLFNPCMIHTLNLLSLIRIFYLKWKINHYKPHFLKLFKEEERWHVALFLLFKICYNVHG